MFQSILDSWKDNDVEEQTHRGRHNNYLTNNIRIIGACNNVSATYEYHVNDIIGLCNFILDKKEYDNRICHISAHIKMSDCICITSHDSRHNPSKSSGVDLLDCESQNKLIILQQVRDLINKIYDETMTIYIREKSISFNTKSCPKIIFVFQYSKNNSQIIQNLFFDMFIKISNCSVYIGKKVDIGLFNNFTGVYGSNNYVMLDDENDYYEFLSNLGSSITNIYFSNKYTSIKPIHSIHLPNLTRLSVNIYNQNFTVDLTDFIKNHTSITSLKIDARNNAKYDDRLIDYLINNTHIQKLQCIYGTDIKTVSKLLEENTTLVDLAVTTNLIRELNVKYIKPNFIKVVLNCTVKNFQPIIESNCQFFTIHKCNVSDSELLKLFEENPYNIPLSTIVTYCAYITHDTIIKFAKRILKKNITLEMLLINEKYWIQ